MKENKNIGIRETIIIAFVVFSSVSMAAITITTAGFINNAGSVAAHEMTASLESQVIHDMQNKTASYAEVIQSRFEQVKRDIDGLAASTSTLFSTPNEFAERASYYHVDMLPSGTFEFGNFGSALQSDTYYPQNVPLDATFDPDFEMNVSKTFSQYMIYESTWNAMGGNPYNLTGIHGDYINRSAYLDPLMQRLIDNNPSYAWIYIEFQNGIQRTFPWTGVDTTVFRNVEAEPQYDYKEDGWYTNAVLASGNVVWESPYIDPYLGWIVTASRAVYNGSTFIGVIGIDFTLEAITTTVGNIHAFETGYGFLIDQDGYVISHPNIVFNPEEEEASIISDIEPLTEQMIDSLVSNPSGSMTVVKNNKRYYLAHATVPINSYVLGIIVPSSEVLAPVTILERSVDERVGITTAVTIFITVGIIIVTLVIGIKVASTIVKPISRLAKLAMDLSTEDIKKTLSENSRVITELDEMSQQSDEIGGLSKSFKSLVMMVRDENNDGNGA